MKSRSRRAGGRPSAWVGAAAALFLFAFHAPLGAQQGPPEVIPFDVARMIIEFNSSANEGIGDVGVQVSLDGDSWNSLTMTDPRGKKILDIAARKSLGKQGLTELFFESSEPSLDEVPLEDFLERFPEGEYEFEGRTIEGERIQGTAAFTHVIPAGPVIVSPEEGDIVDPTQIIIEWEPVTTKIAGSGPLVVVAYQVIVEGGDPSRAFDVTVAAKPTNMTVTVPPEFLEPGTEYAFEILAIEAGGNQTITEGSFSTAP
jgi:hypothetical protein